MLGSPLRPAAVAVEIAAVGSPVLVVFPHGPWDFTVASIAGVRTGGHVTPTFAEDFQVGKRKKKSAAGFVVYPYSYIVISHI